MSSEPVICAQCQLPITDMQDAWYDAPSNTVRHWSEVHNREEQATMTDEQIQQLIEIRNQYDAEPGAPGSDEATERDLKYFDRIMLVLHQPQDHGRDYARIEDQERAAIRAEDALVGAVRAARPRRELRHRVSMLVNDWERIVAAVPEAE